MSGNAQQRRAGVSPALKIETPATPPRCWPASGCDHRLSQVFIGTAFIGICLCLLHPGRAFGLENTERPSSQKGLGTVEGVITYKADSSRRWRYARYYVDRKTDHLAEAVVALSGKGLAEETPTQEPRTTVVDQKNFQFIPETTAIRAGDRIRFLNNDGAVHNVAAAHLRHSFNVNLQPGRSHEEVFPMPRKISQPYRLGCIYHSAMRAWIFVFDHPHFHVTEKNGEFRFLNLPPGDYTLDLVHPAGELRRTVKISVRADAVTQVDTELSPDDKSDKNR